MPRHEVHPRQLELIRPIGEGRIRDVAVRVDQEVRRRVDADIFEAVLRKRVPRQHLPPAREALRQRDFNALVALDHVRIVGDDRSVRRRGPREEPVRRIVRGPDDAVDAWIDRGRERARVRIVRVHRRLEELLAAVRIADAHLEVRHQLAIDAERVLVGVGPLEVRVDGRENLAVDEDRADHGRAGLLAKLELVIAVEVAPGVLLAVVRVAVHVADAAAAGRQDVVVAADRRLRRRAAVAAHVVDRAEARTGGTPFHDVANLVVAACLRREAADAGRRKL